MDGSELATPKMDQQITPKEVKILENPEDIQERREQVLGRYANFKSEALNKRGKLEDSRRFQVRFYFSISTLSGVHCMYCVTSAR